LSPTYSPQEAAVSALPIVREHMDTYVHTLRPDMSVLEAIDLLLDKGVTGAPVVTPDGRLVGLLDERECLQLIAEGDRAERPRGKVADYMVKDVQTVEADMDIYYVAGRFLASQARRFPVVDGKRLIGAITRYDILRAIQARYAR
jgi:CBS domain-containing protein